MSNTKVVKHEQEIRGIVVTYDDVPEAAVSFAYDESGKANHIYIVRNPDKLGHLSAVVALPGSVTNAIHLSVNNQHVRN